MFASQGGSVRPRTQGKVSKIALANQRPRPISGVWVTKICGFKTKTKSSAPRTSRGNQRIVALTKETAEERKEEEETEKKARKA